MLKAIKKIGICLTEELSFSCYSLVAFGAIGVFGYIIWSIWWGLINQQYQNLLLGVLGLISCFCLLFFKFFQRYSPNFFALYWFIVLTYNLPFFFTFYLIKNNYSQVWLIAELASAFASVMLFRRFWSFLISVIFGISAAVFLLINQGLDSHYFVKETSYFLSLFAVIVGSWFLKHILIRNLAKKNKDELVKSLTAVIANEIFNPVSSIGMINNEIEQIINSSKGLEEDKKFQLFTAQTSIANVAAIANNAMNILIADLNDKPVSAADLKSFSAQDHLLKIIEKYSYNSKEERQKIKLLIDADSDIMIKALPERIEFIIFILLRHILNQQNQLPNFSVLIGTETAYFDKKHSPSDIPQNLVGKEWGAIFLHDNGLGISSELIPKIFENFLICKKGNSAKENSENVANFGLGFCKKSMKLIGGELICQSHCAVDGSGWTKFSLLFPKLPKDDFFLANQDIKSDDKITFSQEPQHQKQIKMHDFLKLSKFDTGSKHDEGNLVNKFLSRQKQATNSQFKSANQNLASGKCLYSLLIVDDQEINLKILKSKIEKNFPTIFCNTAKSGYAAIEMVKDKKYDLVFMDIQMPNMNGIVATQKIKNFDQDIQVVALTSLGKYSFLKNDQKVAPENVDISKLFDGYLSKTAGDNFIMRTLGKWLPGLNDDFCYLGTKLEYIEILRGKKLLLVDDQQMSRVITRRFLEQNGMKIVEALDGQDMLVKYRASLDNCQKSSFDVIIADVNMPILGGDEASMQIRKIEFDNSVSFCDEIPIIALSSDGSRESIQNFFRCGVTDFFIKGNDPEILVKIIANYLTKHSGQKSIINIQDIKDSTLITIEDKYCDFKYPDFHSRALYPQSVETFEQQNDIHNPPQEEPRNEVAAAGDKKNETANKKSFDDFVVLNQDLEKNFSGQERVDLIRLFIENCDNVLVEIGKAAQSQNHESLLFQIHALKGVLASIGADRALSFVRTTEPIIKITPDLGLVWLKKFKVFYDDLKNELKNY